MTGTTVTFSAYRVSDGKPTECVIAHRWEDERPNWRKEREALLVRHGIIHPTNSCALSCLLAAANAEEYR